VTEGSSAEALLRRPLLLRGIRLGQPIDVVLDLVAMRVVGIEVRCGDEAERFLPLPAAELGEAAIGVRSALQLLNERDLAFYRRRATSYRSLRGLEVARGGRTAGTLADLVARPGGAVVELVVDAGGERLAVPVAPGVSIGGRPVASAA
jgi:hypothetical protein